MANRFGRFRPIGAMFHVPHGISNAMLIKECLTFALDGCYEKFATIARTIGAVGDDVSDEIAAKAFLKALVALCKEIEIPTLAQYGIEKKDFVEVIDKMATDAIASGSPANTIKDVTKEDVVAIYEKLWD